MPVGLGRYDDLKSAGENIELQTTILSRFDLIFIVKDERNADRDRQIAKCASCSQHQDFNLDILDRLQHIKSCLGPLAM